MRNADLDPLPLPRAVRNLDRVPCIKMDGYRILPNLKTIRFRVTSEKHLQGNFCETPFTNGFFFEGKMTRVNSGTCFG